MLGGAVAAGIGWWLRARRHDRAIAPLLRVDRLGAGHNRAIERSLTPDPELPTSWMKRFKPQAARE
jgi:hypothetical protein